MYQETWCDLVVKLSKHLEIPEKSQCKTFTGAEFIEGSSRAHENVKQIHLFILDFDDVPIDAVRNIIKEYEFEAVLVSTFSYEPEYPCFRAILLPSRPVSRDEWSTVFWGLEQVFNNSIDLATKDAPHVYFYPSCPLESADTLFEHYAGNLCAVDELLEMGAKHKPIAQPQSTSLKTTTKLKKPKQLTVREMADEVVSLTKGKLWFYQGSFRRYLNNEGFWAKFKQSSNEFERLLMNHFAHIDSNLARRISDSLSVLCSNEEVIENCNELCVTNGRLELLTGNLYPHTHRNRVCFISWRLTTSLKPKRLVFNNFFRKFGKEKPI